MLYRHYQVLRTTIVMDLGESLNPAIYIGQIEGGFIQGLGLFTLEEPLYSPTTGQILTRGPSNYKIPSADDIPEEFTVSLLRGSSNPHAVYSSKVKHKCTNNKPAFQILLQMALI